MFLSFCMPVNVECRENAVSLNAEKFSSLGERCLIVTGGSSAKKCGALFDVTAVLESRNISYEIYDGITQNPTVSSCLEAGKSAGKFGADFIIGIGGGSPLDASKAAAVFAANEGLDEAGLYSLSWKNPPLPVAAIGTTAGTGSEVTPVSVLTNSQGLKKSIRDSRIYPVFSLSDPKYMSTLPDVFTRSTAVDALAHCVESFFSKKGNDYSRANALYGIKILTEEFRKIADGKELCLSDREKLYNASILGGIAISVSGTAFPHAMGYFLSESHEVPHGTACAVFLPDFIGHCVSADEENASSFFKSICCEKDEFISLIKEVTPKMNISVSDEERLSLLPRWKNNRGLLNTAGDFSQEDADSLIKKLFR